MRRVGPVLVLVLVLGGAGTTFADSVAETAQAVAEAVDDRNGDRLRALAARDDPDPWLVADALCAEGRVDAARAFAAAAGTRPDVATLGDHLARWQPGDDDVASIGTLADQGRSLVAKSQPGEAAARYAEAAARARDLGWLAGAGAFLYEVVVNRLNEGNLDAALGAARARLEVETTLGSETGIGRGHYNVAYVLLNRGETDAALPHLASAKRAATAVGDAEYVAKARAAEAYLAAMRGDTESAVSRMAAAIAALDEGGNEVRAARFRTDPARLEESRVQMLLTCVTWLANLGYEDEARAALDDGAKRAAALDRPALGAQIAFAHGGMDERAGRLVSALERYREAARLYTEAGQVLDAFGMTRRAAGILSDLGAFAEVLTTLEPAIAELRRRGAKRELARALLEAGHAATRLGRLEPGRQHLEEALGLADEIRDPQLWVETLGRLGEHELARGNYARALAHLERALERQTELKQCGCLGALLLDLGRVYETLREPERALELYRRAGRQLESEKDTYRASLARQGAAFVLSGLARYDEAQAEMQAVLDAETARKNGPGVAAAEIGLGDIAWAREDWAEALLHHRRALAQLASSNDARQTAMARSRVGLLLALAGHLDEAQALLEAAHEDAERTGAVDVRAWCRLNLAEFHLTAGRAKEAQTWARRGVEDIAGLGWDLAEGEGARTRASLSRLFEVGARAALELNDAAALHTFLEAGRAGTLMAALGGREALRDVAVPAALTRAEDEARAAEVLAQGAYREALRSHDLKAIGTTRETMLSARREVEAVVARIQRTTRLGSDLVLPTSVELPALQAALAADEAWVAYAFALDEALALVVRREDVRVVRLGSAQVVREAAAALHLEKAPFVDEAAIAPLAALVATPLALDASVRRVLVSPDGALAYVPFALLLGERDVAYAPSATTYMLLRSAPESGGTKVLALGDPDYSRTVSPLGRRGRLRKIPATRQEAETVGDEVLLGKDASETRLRRVLEDGRRWRAIHLACHGLVDPHRATLSSLALAGDDEHDGLLTAMDVFRLRMPADLVVLSGCETGKGQIVEGEGIVGLTRAVTFAGAPRVLVSLWKVPDEATRALMVAFYDRWHPEESGEGIGAAAALREAQAVVRADERWQHPHYWAAWVLWGLAE